MIRGRRRRYRSNAALVLAIFRVVQLLVIEVVQRKVGGMTRRRVNGPATIPRTERQYGPHTAGTVLQMRWLLLLRLLRLLTYRLRGLISAALLRLGRILRLTTHVLARMRILGLSFRTGRLAGILCRLASGILLTRIVVWITGIVTRVARIVAGIARIVTGITRVVTGIARIVTGVTRVVAGIAWVVTGIARIARIVSGIVRIVSGIVRIVGLVIGVVTGIVAGIPRIGRVTRVAMSGILMSRIVDRVTRILVMLRRSGRRSRRTRCDDTLRRWWGCSRNRELPRGSRQRGRIPWLDGLLHDGTHHLAQPTAQPADFYLRLEGHYFSFLPRRWAPIYFPFLRQISSLPAELCEILR